MYWGVWQPFAAEKKENSATAGARVLSSRKRGSPGSVRDTGVGGGSPGADTLSQTSAPITPRGRGHRVRVWRVGGDSSAYHILDIRPR
jgi:hypothetical protein